MVTEKAVIFRGQNGIDQVLGSILDPDGNSPLITEFTHEPAVDAVDSEWLLKPDILYFDGWREIGPNYGNNGHKRHGDRCHDGSRKPEKCSNQHRKQSEGVCRAAHRPGPINFIKSPGRDIRLTASGNTLTAELDRVEVHLSYGNFSQKGRSGAWY